jgi:hypothetical protein
MREPCTHVCASSYSKVGAIEQKDDVFSGVRGSKDWNLGIEVDWRSTCWCLFPAPQRKTFPSHSFLHSTPPSTSSSYHPSSCCLTTSSPSDYLRPVPRSLVPPSLLLSCAPLCCPYKARRAVLPPAWCSVLHCPRVSVAARESTSDEPKATKSPGAPVV